MRLEAILVTGTLPRCGKTVVTAGLAASLAQVGCPAQAVKPMDFAPTVSLHGGRDQAFLEAVTRRLPPAPVLQLPSPYAMETVTWKRLLDFCQRLALPSLIEAPGSVAAPLDMGPSVRDVTDWALALNIPVLLVTRKTEALIAETATALTYLREKNVTLAGWVAVETQAVPTPHWDDETLYLSQTYRTPYLGSIAHSTSISVETLHQGNLVRLTEAGIDLLPLQRAFL